MEITQTQIPGFGSYILALFLTPIYCLTRGKYLGFVLSTILYVLAFLTFMLFGLGFIFWAVAAIPAAFSLRNEIIEAHASRTGEATAQALKAAGIGSSSLSSSESSASVEKLSHGPSGSVTPPPETSPGVEKICPMCAETVKSAARICKHCRHEFEIDLVTVVDVPKEADYSKQIVDDTVPQSSSTADIFVAPPISISEAPNKSYVGPGEQPGNRETSRPLVGTSSQATLEYQAEKNNISIIGYGVCALFLIAAIGSFIFIYSSNNPKSILAKGLGKTILSTGPSNNVIVDTIVPEPGKVLKSTSNKTTVKQNKLALNYNSNADSETVIDVNTGLMWSRNAYVSGREMTWEDANRWVKNLTYGGHRDWRLPTKNELSLFAKRGGNHPSEYFNTNGFNNVQADIYWSSSKSSFDPGYAWEVDMENGIVDSNVKLSSYHVWPVRKM